MEYKNLNGKIEEQKSEIRWLFAGIFMIPALIVGFIGCVILCLADLLLVVKLLIFILTIFN